MQSDDCDCAKTRLAVSYFLVHHRAKAAPENKLQTGLSSYCPGVKRYRVGFCGSRQPFMNDECLVGSVVSQDRDPEYPKNATFAPRVLGNPFGTCSLC